MQNRDLSFDPFPHFRSRSLGDVTSVLEQAHTLLNAPPVTTSAIAAFKFFDKFSVFKLWDGFTYEHGLHQPHEDKLMSVGSYVSQLFDCGRGLIHGNAYYNTNRSKEVMTSAVVLGKIAEWQGAPLSPREKELLFFSAMVKDYDREAGNKFTGPLHLKTKSFNKIDLHMLRHGVDKDTRETVKLLILATDVGHTADYVNALKAGSNTAVPQGYEALAPLGDPKHKRTVELAAMLRDADVLMAVGVTANTAKATQAKMGAELKKVLGYKEHLDLLGANLSQPDGLGGRTIGFMSDTGKFFNPNIPKVTQMLRPEKQTAEPAKTRRNTGAAPS